MRQVVWKTMSPGERAAALRRPALAEDAQLRAQVAKLLAQVRAQGDAALMALTRRFDGVELEALEVSEQEFSAADAELTDAQRRAIQLAADHIERFHRAQMPEALVVDIAPGVRCERLTRPIDSVGLYVPAGGAPLPSTALMLAIPAALAGCQTRVLCSPPQRDGRADPAVLHVARRCSVQRVFKLGGAQAIAAMAYGTESVPKVAKIFGPGNAWVTAAKAQVSQDPDGAAQDLPAGPSEVLVIADEKANPAFVAADLLSQAEHGADSQVLLVTTSDGLAATVRAEIETQKARLSRRAVVEQSLAQSTTILVDDLATALAVSNRYAPEHLILQVESPRDWLDSVQAAGSVFLGPWAPESVGDYCSGTNHVLPTYGLARAYSSLGLSDFLRAMTVQELTREGLALIGPVAQTLAELEGLDAHGAAVSQRLDSLSKETEDP